MAKKTGKRSRIDLCDRDTKISSDPPFKKVKGAHRQPLRMDLIKQHARAQIRRQMKQEEAVADQMLQEMVERLNKYLGQNSLIGKKTKIERHRLAAGLEVFANDLANKKTLDLFGDATFKAHVLATLETNARRNIKERMDRAEKARLKRGSSFDTGSDTKGDSPKIEHLRKDSADTPTSKACLKIDTIFLTSSMDNAHGSYSAIDTLDLILDDSAPLDEKKLQFDVFISNLEQTTTFKRDTDVLFGLSKAWNKHGHQIIPHSCAWHRFIRTQLTMGNTRFDFRYATAKSSLGDGLRPLSETAALSSPLAVKVTDAASIQLQRECNKGSMSVGT